MKLLTADASAGGEWAWIELRVADGTIVSGRGGGEGAAALCRAVRGRSPLDAAAVPGEPLALDALHAALADAIDSPPEPRRVLVAMSGGVDSAVALHHVMRAGYAPVGVTLRLWIDPLAPDSERACCSPMSVRAARELCHQQGLPHITVDRRQAFRTTVIEPFVSSYSRGETPNPCSRCNGVFRFAELEACRQKVGAARLATGHYARIVEQEGRLLIGRPHDLEKDQSYMLAGLGPDALGSLWFPLGEQLKSHTRSEAAELGLAAARRPESQEACFLGGGDYRDFLERQGLSARPGDIVHVDGRALGEHSGYWRFTPGQRRGLSLGGSNGPLYVVEADPERNAVVVGPRCATGRTRLGVRPGRLHLPVETVDLKVRHRSPAVAATIQSRAGGFEARLDEPAFGVARGQVAVAYRDGAVVGAGLIDAVAD